jgi:hypothetical protein
MRALLTAFTVAARVLLEVASRHCWGATLAAHLFLGSGGMRYLREDSASASAMLLATCLVCTYPWLSFLQH